MMTGLIFARFSRPSAWLLFAAAQTVHAQKSYDHPAIRFGHRYVDILGTSEDGRLRVDYGRFHDTLAG